jgi:exopolysaccharide production protein ExoQ
VLGRKWLSKRHIGTIVLLSLAAFATAEYLFDIYAKGVQMLGRDPSLTDRTEVWADALALVADPVFGAGFESFWLGERLDKLWAKWWWQPNQAHNGYIEVYLNLGLLGIAILLGLIVSTFRKIRVDLLTDLHYGRLRLAFLFVVLAYNYTEATFKGVHLIWLVFHIMAIDYRRFFAAGVPDRLTPNPAIP